MMELFQRMIETMIDGRCNFNGNPVDYKETEKAECKGRRSVVVKEG